MRVYVCACYTRTVFEFIVWLPIEFCRNEMMMMMILSYQNESQLNLLPKNVDYSLVNLMMPDYTHKICILAYANN